MTPQDRFVSLFRSHSRPLLGYALRRVTSPDDAADVVADTMLVAWRRIDDVPAGDEARLWLYGVARLVLANDRRGDGRRERLGERLRQSLRGNLTTTFEEALVVDVALQQAIQELPDDEREVLLLSAWEGLTPSEIASVCELNPATVRTRLHRARQKIRAHINSKESPERRSVAGHVDDMGNKPLAPTKHLASVKPLTPNKDVRS